MKIPIILLGVVFLLSNAQDNECIPILGTNSSFTEKCTTKIGESNCVITT